MARRVAGETGTANVVLPGGWVLDAGDEVVIPDEEWKEIDDDPDLASRVEDLGYTSDLVTPVPSFRDMQRAVAGSSTGLEGQVSDLNDALIAHLADTSSVHGIADTSKLGWLQQVSLTGADVGEVLTKTGASAYGFAPAGVDPWEQTYNFVVASDNWVINHGQGTKAIHVEVESNTGEPMDAKVVYVDLNNIHVQHYFPETGSVRLWALT